MIPLPSPDPIADLVRRIVSIEGVKGSGQGVVVGAYPFRVVRPQ